MGMSPRRYVSNSSHGLSYRVSKSLVEVPCAFGKLCDAVSSVYELTRESGFVRVSFHPC
jgi:hypothetical protein